MTPSSEPPAALTSCLVRVVSGPPLASPLAYLRIFDDSLCLEPIPAEPALFGIPLPHKAPQEPPEIWRTPRSQVLRWAPWRPSWLPGVFSFLAQDHRLEVALDGGPVSFRIQVVGDEKEFFKLWAQAWPEALLPSR